MNEYNFQVSILSETRTDLFKLMADLGEIDKSQSITSSWNKTKKFLPTLGQAFTNFTSEFTETADVKHKTIIQLTASIVGKRFVSLTDQSLAVIHLQEREYGPKAVKGVMVELFNTGHERINTLFVGRADLAKFILSQLPQQLVDLHRDENPLGPAIIDFLECEPLQIQQAIAREEESQKKEAALLPAQMPSAVAQADESHKNEAPSQLTVESLLGKNTTQQLGKQEEKQTEQTLTPLSAQEVEREKQSLTSLQFSRDRAAAMLISQRFASHTEKTMQKMTDYHDRELYRL